MINCLIIKNIQQNKYNNLKKDTNKNTNSYKENSKKSKMLQMKKIMNFNSILYKVDHQLQQI